MKGEFHAPELDPEFFPGHVTDDGEVVDLLFADFANGWFALDRIMLVRLFMAAIFFLLFVGAFMNPKLVPK